MVGSQPKRPEPFPAQVAPHLQTSALEGRATGWYNAQRAHCGQGNWRKCRYTLCLAFGVTAGPKVRPLSSTRICDANLPGRWHTSMCFRERAVLVDKSSRTRGLDGGRHWESLLRDGGPKPGGRFGPRRRRQAPSLTTTRGSERALRHTGVVMPPEFRHWDVVFG